MGKFTFHLIKKLTGIDIEQLQNDNEALLIKNQQLSFEVKDANKEATYKRTQLTKHRKSYHLHKLNSPNYKPQLQNIRKDFTSPN